MQQHFVSVYHVDFQLCCRHELLATVLTDVIPDPLVNLDVRGQAGGILEHLPALGALELLSVAVLEVHGSDVSEEIARVVEVLAAMLTGERFGRSVMEPLMRGQRSCGHELLVAFVARKLSLAFM